MKAILWHDETMGAEYDVEDIPAELVDECNEWRQKMIELAAEQDETLMEKFFEDPNSLSEEEIVAAIRKGTLALDIVPMTCGSSFKNKGVQTLLDYVVMFLPSPLDTPAIEGTNPDTGEVETREVSETKRLLLSRSRSLLTPTLVASRSSAYTPVRSKPVLTFITYVRVRRNAFRVSSRCTPTSRTPLR